jgi:redox-sensitive bicupin YhaK (pirin superfamily)
MITRRPAAERGHADHGWLDARHTFSFAGYHDPAWMGFRALRVLNEDRVLPGRGFSTHPHRDMEILTWVLEGALEHRDSMGNGSVIRPGEMQYMRAGTGVLHSETNPSPTAPVHLLQIWILPEEEGLTPGYDQRAFGAEDLEDRLHLVASGDEGTEAIRIHQDARVHVGRLREGAHLTHALAPGRHAWVQVARGALLLDGVPLGAGDGAAVSEQPTLTLEATAPAEVILFDLA